MVNRNIQMKKKNNDEWENLFPISLQENIYNNDGEPLPTTLENIENDFTNNIELVKNDIEDINNNVSDTNEKVNINNIDLSQRFINVKRPPYNAKGDGVTNDYDAIMQAYNDANDNDTLLISSDQGFVVDKTLVFDKGVNIEMRSPIILDTNSNIPAIEIGSFDGQNMSIRKLKFNLKVSRKNRTTWTNDNDIGIKLINQFSNDINIQQVEGFTVGIEAVGNNSGFSHNQIRLHDIVNNHKHVILTALNGGYVNENLWIGGRFTNFGADTPDNNFKDKRRAIVIHSPDNSYINNNNNIFLKPCFQNKEGIGIDIIHGAMNKVIAGRSEGPSYNSSFSNASNNNEIEILYATTGNSERYLNKSNNSTNIVTLGRYSDVSSAQRVIVDRNNMEELSSVSDNKLSIEDCSFLRLPNSNDDFKTYITTDVASIVHDSLNITSGVVGNFLTTDEVKKFVIQLGTTSDSDHWVMVMAFDGIGNRLPQSSNAVIGADRAGERFTQYTDGLFRTSPVGNNYVSFEVSEETKKIWVGVGRSSAATAKLKGYQILTNEKYMGDALLQKTYTVDFLNKKRVKNDGIAPQYYVENSHEAIIPKEIFMRVQEEMDRRANMVSGKGKRRVYSSKYALSSIVYCSKCGDIYRRIAWNNRGKKYIVWRCCTRVTHGPEACEARTIREEDLQEAVVEAINQLISESSELKEIIKENIEKAITGDGSSQIEEIDKEMLKVQEELLKVANAKKDYTDLADRVEELRNKKEKILLDMAEEKNEQSRLKELEEFLDNQELEIESYDEELVRKLVDKIVVYEEKLKVVFKSGIEIDINK